MSPDSEPNVVLAARAALRQNAFRGMILGIIVVAFSAVGVVGVLATQPVLLIVGAVGALIALGVQLSGMFQDPGRLGEARHIIIAWERDPERITKAVRPKPETATVDPTDFVRAVQRHCEDATELHDKLDTALETLVDLSEQLQGLAADDRGLAAADHDLLRTSREAEYRRLVEIIHGIHVYLVARPSRGVDARLRYLTQKLGRALDDSDRTRPGGPPVPLD